MFMDLWVVLCCIGEIGGSSLACMWGMMHLPSGIKVFWPLMTCTPRLNMFGDGQRLFLIYRVEAYRMFGISGGERTSA